MRYQARMGMRREAGEQAAACLMDLSRRVVDLGGGHADQLGGDGTGFGTYSQVSAQAVSCNFLQFSNQCISDLSTLQCVATLELWIIRNKKCIYGHGSGKSWSLWKFLAVHAGILRVLLTKLNPGTCEAGSLGDFHAPSTS